MCKNLKNHADALDKVKSLLVHTAQRPDQYPNPLGEFYEWLARKYKRTTRQQLIRFNLSLKNMSWSWETNPADRIIAIMHEENFTWDEVESNDALRDDIKAFIGSKMDVSMYSTLCEKPVKEWYAAITEIWEGIRINEQIEENTMANVTSTKNQDTREETIIRNKRTKICFKCGLEGHIAHNCKTKMIKRERKNTYLDMRPTKRYK